MGWTEWAAEIGRRVDTEGLDGFLRWDIIRKTMFVDYEAFTPALLAIMRADSQWELWESLMLSEPATGGPSRSGLLGCSNNRILQVFHLYSFWKEKGDISGYGSVFEFGGGYGCLCDVIRRAGFKGKYVIFDLKEMGCLQAHFLQGAAELRSDEAVLDEVQDRCVFIANWSLSEAPMRLRARVEAGGAFAGATARMLSFQDKFEGMDNMAYFARFGEIRPIPHIPGNYRVIG